MCLRPIYSFPSWTGICSSTAFVGLAMMLVLYNGHVYLIVGQVAQYLFSTACWWHVSFPSSVLHNCNENVVLYGDRVTAVLNTILLASFYINKDKIGLDPLLMTLSLTVGFKILDSLAHAGTRVSIWYLLWHLNVFLNNASIICCNEVLPLYVMIVQHVTGLFLTGILVRRSSKLSSLPSMCVDPYSCGPNVVSSSVR